MEPILFISKAIFLMVDRDLPTAFLLSGIVNKFDSKETVIRDGKNWVMKKDNDWMRECYLSVRQVKNAKRKLKKIGLIETANFLHNGIRTPHIKLTEKFDNAFEFINAEIHANGEPSTGSEYKKLIKMSMGVKKC
jgi:hypothetical protein